MKQRMESIALISVAEICLVLSNEKPNAKWFKREKEGCDQIQLKAQEPSGIAESRLSCEVLQLLSLSRALSSSFLCVNSMPRQAE